MNSPPALLQNERKSIKAALRKKDGTTVDAKLPASHVKRPTRKRSLNPELEDALVRGIEDGESASRQVKRRKGLSELEDRDVEAVPSEPALPTSGKSRAVKRYGGKKGKMASPATSDRVDVDYDCIPDTSAAGVSVSHQKSPSPPPKRIAPVPVPRKTKLESANEKVMEQTSTRSLRNRPDKRGTDVGSDTNKDVPSRGQTEKKRRNKPEEVKPIAATEVVDIGFTDSPEIALEPSGVVDGALVAMVSTTSLYESLIFDA